MEILKKDILKEMEKKSQENLDKGIDIAVSILKNEFPFVTGWKYKDDPNFFNSTVYIMLICDMDKSSEFYNSPIKDYYKNLEADVTYPFSPLEMSNEKDNDEKYELYKEIQKSLDETYYEIPNDYRHTFKSFISNTDLPKEIYIDGFVFPAPEKLSESESSNNKVSLAKSLIERVLNTLVLPQYEHVICGFELKNVDDESLNNVINYPGVTVTFIGGYGTKMWPQTQAVQKMYDDVLDDIWDTIYNYTGISVELYSKYVKDCKESINENWFKVPSSDYNSLEKIINLEMKEKYSWWKDIKINTLNYIELYGDAQIEAELTVDEEWGANQWGEFYYNVKFPGNKGWEDNDGYNRRVSLGDIIDSTYANEIRDDLREILKYTLNIEMFGMSFTNVYLIFE
jgi:hypothetical protein